MVNDLCNLAGTVYLSSRSTKCDCELLLMAPPTPLSLRLGLCVVGECTPEEDAYQVYAIHMYFHHLYTDRTYSHQ